MSSPTSPSRTQKIQGRYGFAQVGNDLCLVQCWWFYFTTANFPISHYHSSVVSSPAPQLYEAHIFVCFLDIFNVKYPPIFIFSLKIASYVRLIVFVYADLHNIRESRTTNIRQRRRTSVLRPIFCPPLSTRNRYRHCFRLARCHGTLRSAQRLAMSGHWFLQT